ncbi:hypothetical protein TSUD_87100 [Trifolium subterraneum]|uniref:Reverse transcriptase domain-containing protein n=1 Tax=Trifolium subterraneum TaxID=3900 RepID=A0A2Z6PKY1_TRISU|nr:hypothetical protein TSUD_87100 [Trifolium subterraneum]
MKRKLLTRIGGIQTKIQERRVGAGLRNLEQKLQNKLAELLKQEELMWFQRSRAKWLADGDRNTLYYHLKATIRRRRNNIIMLRNSDKEWVEDPSTLHNMVTEFYKNLFSKPNEECEWFQTNITYPRLEVSSLAKLENVPDSEEIKYALFSMSPWKAPGPDGYPAGFYQQAWNIVGEGVVDFVKLAWQNPMMLENINCTDICLIPKVAQPEFVNQFRPISLCNRLYKVVSKVVVNQLKEFIPVIISPYQTGFVPGRSIHENIVVAQELLHSRNRMTGKRGYFAIKVDLAKAYDMLRWDFIHKTLQEVGFPPGMIEVIMHGVTTVTTNVKWNGARTEYFRPYRGIRQGDPMSPYLFVLCMDKLSHMISQAVDGGKWVGIRAGRAGPIISHLMFADDLLLYGKATAEHMQCVIKVLDDFCILSGQKVSQEKTSILFSKNVPQEVKTMLQNISGFRVTSSLGKYLGVPLTGRAPKRGDYQYIIEQLQSKLTAWKAKNLSFAGRVKLAKSVMEAMPIYPMMTAIIPNSILQEVQRLQRDFIWGDSIHGIKHHAVRWELISTPKYRGGLGLRRLEIMNKACLMKLGWELNHNDVGLWSAVLEGKYGRDINNLVNAQAKNNDSSLWRILVHLQQDIDRFSCWAVGDGSKVHAWESFWIEPGLRICDLNVNIPINLMHANKLYAIPPPCGDNGNDIKVWPAGKSDRFSVNSAYALLSKDRQHMCEDVWSKIWKLLPERVRSFVWLMKHDRVLTRDCSKCIGVWLCSVDQQSRELFFTSDLQQWIKFSINGAIGGIGIENWSSFWAIACHSFGSAKTADNIVQVRNNVRQNIGWIPPKVDWVVVNTDGARSSTGSCGCGGVVRNKHEKISL